MLLYWSFTLVGTSAPECEKYELTFQANNGFFVTSSWPFSVSYLITANFVNRTSFYGVSMSQPITSMKPLTSYGVSDLGGSSLWEELSGHSRAMVDFVVNALVS